MIFVMIGPTGAGKTNFINILTGTSGEDGTACLKAGTRNVSSHPVECDGRRLVFIDTPGLDNTDLSDTGILTLVAGWLEINFQPNIEIGIIYFHRITDNRAQGSPHKHIEMLRKQCSGMVVRQICLVTTMWDEVINISEAEMRERFLEEEFQGKNVRMLFKRSNNKPSSAWDAITEFIQDRLAPKFLVIGPTGAGKTNFINTLSGTRKDDGAACLKANTQSISSHMIECGGQRLVFIDTPGLDNPDLSDAGIFSLVADWLKINFQPTIEMGIIYFHRITDNRIQGAPHRHIEILRKHCSSVVMCQICLVTTMWDEADDTAEVEAREILLKEEFQRKNFCVLFKRFNNQCSSARDVVTELIQDRLAPRFLVMGPTGAGKTNFINTLAGTLGDDRAACLSDGTRDISSRIVERNGQRLVFIDTPGLDGTYLSDAEIIKLVAEWLKINSPPHAGLGIVYFHRITDNRIRSSPCRHVEMLRKQCTGVIVRQVCLVTTMWDEVDDTVEAEMRETLLKGEFQKWNVRALFKHFDNQHSSAWNIASELMGGEGRRLQEELEDRQQCLSEPGTGRASYIKLQLLFSRRKQVLQSLITQAAIEGNVSRVHDLQAELDILDARMQLTFEELRERKISIIGRVLQWLVRKLDTTLRVSSPSVSDPEK